MIITSFLLLLSIIGFSIAPNVIFSRLQTVLSINDINKQTKINLEKTIYTPTAEKKIGSTELKTDAKVALIYDLSGKKMIYAKAENESVAIASLTKLMTALVIMQNHSPDEIVTIPDNLPELTTNDQKIGIKAGEKFVLSDLMSALLIHSANDVANALAVWDSGSMSNFSAKMNSYASQWGLEESNFINPSGLDEETHQSSASNLLVLATILVQNKNFADIVNTQSKLVKNTDDKNYLLTSTNKLLNLPYVYGIKTGFTEKAGQSLILLAEKDGHQIITVVLDSPDRFTESNNMIKYTFNNYTWK
jgi:D-alanyl-D-alanine carboxypeptidase